MPTTRFLALLMLLAPLAATAESWTNQAGRVIEATLQAFDGDRVTLVRTDGAVLQLPLSALCPADQRRVRVQSAQSIAPDFVRAAYKDARSVLDRFEALPTSRRTPEGRQKAVLMACSVFDARIRPRAAELQEQAVQHEVQRLRASLLNPSKD